MSTIIGQLRVMLGLETAAFEASAKRAVGKTKELGDATDKLSTKISATSKAFIAAGAAMVGSQVFQAIAGQIEKSLTKAKQIQEMAQVAGATVEEFQRAAFAAKTVGVESDKLSDIYKDINDKIGEFLSTGGGELKDFFEKVAPKVGVTADQFARLSGPEALQLYFNTLERAGASHKQMTFYMEAVADDASKLIPLLRNNGAEYNRLAKAASELGIVLSREELRAMGETAKKAQMLRDVLSAKIDAEVARNTQSINDLADALIKLVGAAGDAVKAWREWRLESSIRLNKMLSDNPWISEDERQTARNRVKLGEYKLDTSRGVPHKPVTIVPGAAVDPVRNLYKPLKPGQGVRPSFLNPGNIDFSRQLAPFAGSPFPARAMGGGNLFAAMTSPLFEGLGRQLDDLKEVGVRPLGGEVDRLKQGLQITGPEIDRMKSALTEIKPTAKELAQATRAMGRSMEETVQGLLGALNGLAYAFGGRSAGGKFLGQLNAILGFGAELGKLGAFGKSFQSRFLDGARASGGPVNAGGLYLVGERGPELLQMGSRSGHVFPNGAGAGGNTFVFKGNLLTPEFWAQIQAMDVASARAGASIANRGLARAQMRSLAR